MSYETQPIVDRIKEVRQAKSMSQRELCKLAGVPQGQISRIESNAVDLRLSSLIAIANALDLELALVPRKAITAVQSITRQTTDHRPPQYPAIGKELSHMQKALRSLRTQSLAIPQADEFQKALSSLNTLSIPTDYLAQIRNVRKAVEQTTKSQNQMKAITDATKAITYLRNNIAHSTTTQIRNVPPKPAYSLEEDDDA